MCLYVIMNSQIPTHGNNNMMEMLKSQMMTMTMVSSMNNNGSSSKNDSYINMVYIFLATSYYHLYLNNLRFIPFNNLKYRG